MTATSSPPDERRSELARSTLAVLFIGGLLGASVWIVRPFVAAFIWAVMIVVATWPIFRRLEHLLWDRRGLAVATMCGGLLAILIVPIVVATDALLSNAKRVPVLIAWLKDAELPRGHFITKSKCRLLKLHHDDFHRLENASPEIGAHMRRKARERRESTAGPASG